jgi:ABC-type sulfate transport system substrate-binding protein
MKNIEMYSNPSIVLKRAKEMYGNDVQIFLSTRKDKKYMIINPKTNRYINFGQMGYEDYTKHQDEERREKFLKRNKKWKDKDKYSPGYLSYYLLW